MNNRRPAVGKPPDRTWKSPRRATSLVEEEPRGIWYVSRLGRAVEVHSCGGTPSEGVDETRHLCFTRPWPAFGVGSLFDLLVLLLLLGSFGAGYLTRSMISRQRRAEARRWAPYTQPNWLPSDPANRNEKAPPARGELGQMLARWHDRALSRRLAS